MRNLFVTFVKIKESVRRFMEVLGDILTAPSAIGRLL